MSSIRRRDLSVHATKPHGTERVYVGRRTLFLVERYVLLRSTTSRHTAVGKTSDPHSYRFNVGHKLFIIDTLHHIREINTRRPLLMYRSDEAQPKMLISRIYDANDYDVNTSLQSIVLNNKFVVRALSNSFYVLCYDGSVRIPETSGTFFDIGTLEIQDPLAMG